MKLGSNEKAIIAAFRTDDQARKAQAELEELGIIDSKISRVDFYADDDVDNGIESPLTGRFSLTNSVFDARMDDDDRILLGSDPDASGLIDQHDESYGGRDVILTVVVHSERLAEAERILKKHRAYF